MPCIATQVYTIDPSYDLALIDSQELQHVWMGTLEPEVEIQRENFLQMEINSGTTTLMDFAAILDKTARTYTRSRDYTTLEAAQNRKQFMDDVIGPDIGAPFTFTQSFITEDASLTEKGWITNP